MSLKNLIGIIVFLLLKYLFRRSVLYLKRRGLESAVTAAKVNFSSIFLRPNGAQLDELREYIEAGKLKAVIKGNVFEGIDKAPDAMAALEAGRTTGKVVVKIV